MSDGRMPKYRVFISYSRQDLPLVEKIEAILKDNDLIPLWDKNFAYGDGFHEQIKKFIAHAHVFLPIITKTADRRKWVHQEIGYAMALNVPILPMTEGTGPGAMIQQIQAIPIEAGVETFKRKLSWEVIDKLVRQNPETRYALFQCAEFDVARATLMASYANVVLDLDYHALLRQQGALSSLHIPNKGINHPSWRERYGGVDRGPERCRLQLEERLALEKHARAKGCMLMINPYLLYEKWGPAARICRLKCLLEFLESMPDDICQVAINDDMDHAQSVTIVGDWFAAESVSATIGQGYKQTIFTRHAPTVMKKIETFDREFRERLELSGWSPETSRKAAIDLIREIVSETAAIGV